ncbi:unnamed protein product [Closterium sp. NIES-53]
MYLVREANHMIEEFMLAANVSVAEKILQHFASCSLLRRHPTPSPNMFEPPLHTAEAEGIDSIEQHYAPAPHITHLLLISRTCSSYPAPAPHIPHLLLISRTCSSYPSPAPHNPRDF